MSYQLRPYQSDLLARVSESWNTGNRRVMLQLPTGSGYLTQKIYIKQQQQRCSFSPQSKDMYVHKIVYTTCKLW